jgi:mRNA interferase HigB
VKVIKPATVRLWGQKHPTARSSLLGWLALVKVAKFKNFVALRQVYRSADQVQVASGRKVIVFNISGNNYRLIAAVHFNTQRVFALRFLTHAEYSKNQWKEKL